MKNIILLFIVIITICISCTSVNYPNHPKWLCNKKVACKKHTILLEDIKMEMGGFFNNDRNNKIYEDFPNEDTIYGNINYSEGWREGQIINGYKEGKWLSASYKYDTINKTREIERLYQEEYFKKGLRDSIFKQYDDKGNLIYSTYFKMGTGLWKEFHHNGTIYFEIYTNDGYFTDTLKLYNSKGRLQEKLFYKKDSLVYSQKFDTNIVDTLENSKKVRNTYKQRWIDSYNTPDWLYKKEFGNHVWTYNKNGEIVIKTKDTVEKGVKKNYKESIDGNHIIKTIQVVKQKDTLFESEKEYKNEKLIRNKYLVQPTKKNPYPLHIEGYDEQGYKSYLSLGINKSKSKDGIYYLTKTDYFKNKKIIHRSAEILLDVEIIGDELVIEKIEKSYYDLKNKIFKKEYIEHKSGTSHFGCSQGTYSHKYDDTRTIKTEYYEKGKLVRTEINKTP